MVTTFTFFNDQPAASHIGSIPVVAEKRVDFSKNPTTAISDIVNLLTIPAGAVITSAGFYTITTEANITFTLGTEASTYANLLGATAIGADTNMQVTGEALTNVACATETILRTIVAGAVATTAVVTFFCHYYVVSAKNK